MKKFVVTAESDIVDVEFGTDDVNEATALYNRYADSPIFHSVHLYDGETGEVYLSRTIECSPCGITVTQFIAN